MPDVWIDVNPVIFVFCPSYKEMEILTQQSHDVALFWLLLVTKDAKEFAEKMDDSELVISDVEVDDDHHAASHLTNCRTNESKRLDYPLRRSELHSMDLRFSSKERPRTKDGREAKDKDNARDRPLLRTQSSASPESFNGQLFTTGLTLLWKLLP